MPDAVRVGDIAIVAEDLGGASIQHSTDRIRLDEARPVHGEVVEGDRLDRRLDGHVEQLFFQLDPAPNPPKVDSRVSAEAVHTETETPSVPHRPAERLEGTK